MKRFAFYLWSLIFSACLVGSWAGATFAVMPQVSGTQVTDVTPYSFSVIWLSDIAADADIKVFSDAAGVNQITGNVKVEPFPVGNGFEAIRSDAESRGVLKVRVGRLAPSTNYYFRTVTSDQTNVSDVSESALMGPVTTAQVIQRTKVNTSAETVPFSNEQVLYSLVESDGTPAGPGSLLVLDVSGSPYPITGYVGDGIAAPQVLINLNNVYGPGLNSQELIGKERITLKELRTGGDCVLTHFRLVPLNGGKGEVKAPLTGVGASGVQNAKTDLNVDSTVDIQDFALFAAKYGSQLGDCFYNVDYDLDGDNQVNVSDFSIFSAEYGNTFTY